MAESEPRNRTGKLCYIEIPAVDVDQSAQFYERVLGVYQQPGLAGTEQAAAEAARG